jgi:hypothetical protein
MNDATPWTCPTCRTSVSSPFCPACGEHPLHERELTLRQLLKHLFEASTNVDGRILRSFLDLVGHPGVLTMAYLQGRRKPYIGPVPLFLIFNVLFFATEAATGGTVFTTPLQSHLHTQPWSGLAQQLVATRLESLHTTLALYTPLFDQAVGVKARSLIIFMALFFALFPAMLFLRSKRPLIAHAVFALHLYAFLLFVFCLATAIPLIERWLGGAGRASNNLDYVLSISLLLIAAVYLYLSIGTVYGARGVGRVIKTTVLTIAVAAIVLGYRFVLLLITLFTVGSS